MKTFLPRLSPVSLALFSTQTVYFSVYSKRSPTLRFTAFHVSDHYEIKIKSRSCPRIQVRIVCKTLSFPEVLHVFVNTMSPQRPIVTIIDYSIILDCQRLSNACA